MDGWRDGGKQRVSRTSEEAEEEGHTCGSAASAFSRSRSLGGSGFAAFDTRPTARRVKYMQTFALGAAEEPGNVWKTLKPCVGSRGGHIVYSTRSYQSSMQIYNIGYTSMSRNAAKNGAKNK